MAVFYGGTAFQNSQGKVWANSLISESQQLMATDTAYMLDKGLSSFNDFGPDMPAIAGYTNGRIPILGFDTTGYGYDSNFLTSNGGAPNYFTGKLNQYTQRIYAGSIGDAGPHGGYIDLFVTFAGEYIWIERTNGATANGINAIFYYFTICTDSTCTNSLDFAPSSMANNPLVQMCKAVNEQMPPPAGTIYSASGLPEMDVNTDSYASGPPNWFGYYLDSTRTTFNYCYIGDTNGDTVSMYFNFTN